MRILAATALCGALFLGGCGDAQEQATVRDAWVSLPAVPGRPGAAYFTLVGGKTAERLTGVQSPAVDRIELHAAMGAGGMSGMRPLRDVPVPAGVRVALEPRGSHAMLFGIDPALRPGQPVTLLFRFEAGRTVPIEAEARAPGDAPAGSE